MAPKTAKTAKTAAKKPAAAKKPKTASNKPCPPHANGRPRVRNPETKRCGLVAAPAKAKTTVVKMTASPKRPASPKKLPATTNNGKAGEACISPKSKVPGTPYTFLQLANDTKLFWGPVVMALVFAYLMRTRAMWWTTMVTDSAAAQYLLALSPHKRIAKVLAGYIEKTADLKTGWTIDGIKAARDLCRFHGEQIIKKATSEAKRLSLMFEALCSAKIGDDNVLDTAYMDAIRMVFKGKEDSTIRSGVKEMLVLQLGKGHGAGITDVTYNKLFERVLNTTIT